MKRAFVHFSFTKAWQVDFISTHVFLFTASSHATPTHWNCAGTSVRLWPRRTPS